MRIEDIIDDTENIISLYKDCNYEGYEGDYEGDSVCYKLDKARVSFTGVKRKIIEKLNKMQRENSTVLKKLITNPNTSSILITARHLFSKEEIEDLTKYLKEEKILLKYKIDIYAKLAANTEDVYHEVLVKASIFNFTNNCLFTFKIELVNPDDKFIINTIIHNHSAFNHMLII